MLDHNPLAELKWWLLNIDLVNGSPITPPTLTFFIMTDASKTGWRAVFQGHHTKGRWSEDESRLHVNVLEPKATFMALKSFLGLLENGQYQSNSTHKQQDMKI